MYPRHSIFVILPILLASCATNDSSRALVEMPELTHPYLSSNLPSAPTLRGAITREQAIRHAQTYNPLLQSQRAELLAMEAEIIQAGLAPNPELGIDVENFAGSGGTRGFNGAEITAALSQRLELGGKRSKRTLVAMLEAEVHRTRLAATDREVQIDADRAFTTLLETRQIRELSEHNVARAEENLRTLDELLDAGKGNRIDVGKAKLAVSEAKELLAESRAAETNAASELSQTWGGGAANVIASGTLQIPAKGAPLDAEAAIKRHPTMRAAVLGFARAQASYDLEKASRISDIEIVGGVRDFGDADETAAVVGFKVPLPLFDRNQGNIQAAKERLDRAQAEGRAAESGLRSRLTRFSADLRAARSRATEFDARTIDAARQALADTREAYVAGKASVLEVLDARETLFEVERGQTRAQADVLRAQNSLNIMTNN